MSVLRALLALVALLLAGSARAQTPTCPPAVVAWADAAGVGLARTVLLERCPAPRFVVVGIASPDAPLLHVEIAAGPGDALFRVGDTRVSPMVDVPDWSQTFASHRQAVDALVEWLGTHPLPEASAPAAHAPPDVTPARAQPTPHPWLPLATLVAFVALAVAARPARRDVAVVLGVTLLALTLHSLWGAWGIFHVNGQAPLWLSGALHDRRLLDGYGSGYADLFAPFARTPWKERGIWGTNALFWALTAGLTYPLARRLRLRPLPSGLAAGALAVDPVALRFASTESYFPSIVLLGTAATLALVVAADSPRPGRSVAVAVVAAVLALALMVRIHPVAWVPAGLVVVALLALPAVSWRRRVGVAAVVGMGALALALRAVLLVRAGVAPGLLHPFMTLRVPSALALGVVALALALRPASRRFVVPFVAYIAAVAVLDDVFDQSLVARLAFDHLFVVVPVIACASLLPEAAIVGRPRAWTLAVAGVLVAVVFAVARPFILARTTEALEYAWLREELPTLPPGCAVRYVSRATPRVMRLPDYLPGPSVRALEEGEPLDASGSSCTLYARTSLCSGAEGRPVCEAATSGVALRLLASRRFPAAPSYDALGYLEGTVESAIFAVDPLLPGATSRP